MISPNIRNLKSTLTSLGKETIKIFLFLSLRRDGGGPKQMTWALQILCGPSLKFQVFLKNRPLCNTQIFKMQTLMFMRVKNKILLNQKLLSVTFSIESFLISFTLNCLKKRRRNIWDWWKFLQLFTTTTKPTICLETKKLFFTIWPNTNRLKRKILSNTFHWPITLKK